MESTKELTQTGTDSSATTSNPGFDYQWSYKELITEDGRRTEKSCQYVHDARRSDQIVPSFADDVPLSLSSVESLEETRAGSSGEEDTGREKMLAYNSPSSFPGHAYEKRLLPLNVKQEKINEQPKMEKPAEPQKENKVEEADADESEEEQKDSPYMRVKNKRTSQSFSKNIESYRHGYYHFCDCKCHTKQVSPYRRIVRTKSPQAERQRDVPREFSPTKRSTSKQTINGSRPKGAKKGRAKFFVDDKSDKIDDAKDSNQSGSANVIKSQDDDGYQKLKMPGNYSPKKKK